MYIRFMSVVSVDNMTLSRAPWESTSAQYTKNTQGKKKSWFGVNYYNTTNNSIKGVGGGGRGRSTCVKFQRKCKTKPIQKDI